MFVDCTLRDGGYYNAWDFPRDLIAHYLEAMDAAGVDVVEIGFRTLKTSGFSGACAYTTDGFLASLPIPTGLTVGVMINGSELVGSVPQDEALSRLFPNPAADSPVDLVRIACHVHEFEAALPSVSWLKKKGYKVGFNLMQIADRSEGEIKALAKLAGNYPLDVLYFADSMGSMDAEQTARIVGWLRSTWDGALGIHTHDNLGLGLSNTIRALAEGVTWVDSTVTGMGRGPGNTRTEELAIELSTRRSKPMNIVPLMSLIRKHFRPMQHAYGWGTNPYYYLAGKYGIHPTYIQEMLTDSRYGDEDILAAIEHLRIEGGKSFSSDTLDAARHFYQGPPRGSWSPSSRFAGREVLLLGAGNGVDNHRAAIETYIRKARPVVVALNTQTGVSSTLIDLRAACHPVRLLADCHAHAKLPQPLITPASMLPSDVQASLKEKELLDYGLTVQPGQFSFDTAHCTVPTSLVIAYALAIVTSGQASRLLMAGFDGYGGDDPRTKEMQEVISLYRKHPESIELVSVTPTRYDIPQQSIYALSA